MKRGDPPMKTNPTIFPGEEHPGKPQTASPMDSIQRFLLNCLIVITILWVLFGSVIGIMAAPNDDMFPHIKAKDLLLYYRLERSFHAQDVVILKKNETSYVGRVIAAAGDSVEISDDGRLIINSNYVSEPQIYTSTPRLEGFVSYPVELQDGEYFILADARNGAEDSRYYGIVERNEILRKVFVFIRRNQL